MNAAIGMTLVNGRRADQVSTAERALHYGDGLFETISCRDGRPRWLALHLQRLRHGCERLQLPFRDYDALGRDIAELAAWQPRCIVKAIVSRGSATRRGYGPGGDESPTRIVSRHEWVLEEHGACAMRVELSEVSLGINPRLAGLKHLNRLEQVLAQMGRANGVDEVLMLSSTRQVIGGSMSNVFFADESGLFTPELHECGVEGVMRQLVLGAGNGLSPKVRRVEPAELGWVREAFVTNVRWGLRSVALLDGRALPSDDYAQQLRRVIDAARA